MSSTTQGSARQRLNIAEVERLRRTGMLITDERHRRPFYFDGRFLAAQDLTQEQTYFLTRQADLNRAAGVGVVRGLAVSQGTNGFTLTISAGHGVTPSGEMVLLDNDLALNITNVADMQELDATFGLTTIPKESPRNRSGLFILALRAVEYTANPIASYPTTLDGKRTVEDGDIIEAVAVTLVPYGVGATLGDRTLRSTLARQIFVNGTDQGLPSEALPLAMIALDNSVIQWIDVFLVRREVGAEHGNILGMGFTPRALREAHVLQYNQQLEEVLGKSRPGQRLSAASDFAALPPAGQLPASAINPSDFTQSFFPPGIDAELSVLPSDEIAVLVEESLLLPPIDLTLSQTELTSTSVLVLIPVTRQRFRQLQTSLRSLSQSLSSSTPDAATKTNPIDRIRQARIPRIALPVLETTFTDQTEWRKVLEGQPLLWFVRRRNFAYRTPPVRLRIAGNDRLNEDRLDSTLDRIGLTEPVRRLRENSTAIANAELVSFLSAPKLEASQILLGSAIRELEAAAPTTDETPTGDRPIDQATVLKVTERFGDPKLGEGIRRLETFDPQFKENQTVINTLIETGAVPELDRVIRVLPEAEAQAFTKTILTAAIQRNTQDITLAITRKLQEF